jgi:hypothetical protein
MIDELEFFLEIKTRANGGYISLPALGHDERNDGSLLLVFSPVEGVAPKGYRLRVESPYDGSVLVELPDFCDCESWDVGDRCIECQSVELTADQMKQFMEEPEEDMEDEAAAAEPPVAASPVCAGHHERQTS